MARGRGEQDTDTTDTTVDSPRAARVRPVKRARFGVVVLTVLLTELLLIAAGANQGVAKHLASYADDHRTSLLGNALRSLLVLRWSVSASGHSDLWHAELITVGLVLLLGIVLVPMVVHGPTSWLRAFVGTWFTVVIGVCVAAVAGLALSDLVESKDLAEYIIPGDPTTGLSVSQKIDDAVFSGVLTYAVVAGLTFGFVVALIVSTVTVASRHTDPVPVVASPGYEPASSPESPQPFFGSVEDDRTSRTTAYGTGGYGSSGYGTSGYADPPSSAAPDRPMAGGGADNETTTIPAVPGAAPRSYAAADAGTTSELPRTEAVPVVAEPEPVAEADAERTAAFPVPPDDEDLGRHPDHHDD